ncbi:hypothetical protein OS493_031745 [Desmophyllum pertusum]|uniref:Integrase catalytic domain-containing protein n=1 Tax=Desmophyllum pertusum TaxID=174260 RepID=A0A9W9ZJM7_9CNID|nr:hypothetical protein OS493_031745 [Desmophyllum pertusum]
MTDQDSLVRTISEAVSRAVADALGAQNRTTNNVNAGSSPSGVNQSATPTTSCDPASSTASVTPSQQANISNQLTVGSAAACDEAFRPHTSRKQGRPTKGISKDRLQGLLNLKLPVSRIAKAMQVSRPLVYKAIAENNLDGSRYSNVSESELQQAVASVKNNHPNAGEVMLQGHLRAQGIHVQRSRMREAILALDPSVTARKRPAIKRRVYSVPCPNYLWHIDGNHKLIRWRFVIHHCIDGFSRLVTFCRCSTNNRAGTVLTSFQEAIRKYGRPFRIRSDHGGENVDVWRDMVSAWGEEAKCIIVGSSVHNQRIERHNRAANEQELSVFKSEFYDLEREGILDPLNDTDLFCLHYVYLPRLNRNLAEFVSAHNNHKVSTEENNTPAQLFWVNLHLTAFGDGRDSENAYRAVKHF